MVSGNFAGRCRAKTKGKGKRGGLRVIYYWVTPREQILMLTLYRKGEIADLTRTQIRALKRHIDEIET